MTRIVKTADGGAGKAVRRFTRQSRKTPKSVHEAQSAFEAQTGAPSNVHPAPSSAKEKNLHQRISLLETEVERLLEDAQDAAIRAEQTETRAYERGKTDGRANAGELAEKQISQLRAGIHEALTSFDQKAEQVEILALQIGRIALEKVLEPNEDDVQRLTAIVRKQVDAFKTSKPLGVYVSNKDFTSEEMLRALSSGDNRIAIQIDEDLPQGSCVLRLEQGEVEIGAPGQTRHLSTQLESFARDRETRTSSDECLERVSS